MLKIQDYELIIRIICCSLNWVAVMMINREKPFIPNIMFLIKFHQMYPNITVLTAICKMYSIVEFFVSDKVIKPNTNEILTVYWTLTKLKDVLDHTCGQSAPLPKAYHYFSRKQYIKEKESILGGRGYLKKVNRRYLSVIVRITQIMLQ